MAKLICYISLSNSTGTTPSGGGGVTVATGGRAVTPAPIIPEVVPFSLTTGKANAVVPIDYTSITVIKFFNSDILKIIDLLDGE